MDQAVVTQRVPRPALRAGEHTDEHLASSITGIRIAAAVDLREAPGYDGLSARERLERAADEQKGYISSLLEPSMQAAFDLRLRVDPGTPQPLSFALLARTWAADEAGAQERARSMQAHLLDGAPDHVIAEPITAQPELASWLAPFGDAAPGAAAYVTRHEFTGRPTRPDAGVGYYFSVAQLNWATIDWVSLYRRLRGVRQRLMVSVALLPQQTSPGFVRLLQEYGSVYARLGQPLQDAGLSVQRQLAPETFATENEPVFRDYARRLGQRAFAMRIMVAAEGAFPAGVVEAVASSVSPHDTNDGSHLDRARATNSFDIRHAGAEELETARWNLGVVDVCVPRGRGEIWQRQDPPPAPMRDLAVLGDARDAACAFRLPIAADGDLGGFPVRRPGRLGHQEEYATGDRAVVLGTFPDASGTARVSVDSLSKHALVAGSTGSGKTTVVLDLLRQLWLDHQVPFLVIEPVNSEANDYRKLAAIPGLEDLRVITVGDERHRPLRFNPFAVPDGVLVSEHQSNLLNCFKAAFGLWEPLPSIYEDALFRTYVAKGVLPSERGGEEPHEWPTAVDFRRAMGEATAGLSYAGEIKANIEAASTIRAQSLVAGVCASTFLTDCTLDADELLSRPTVIELKALGNGDEQALMIALLLNAMTEHYQANRGATSELAHVTVIEEAHRLLARPGPSGGAEAQAKAQAAEGFANTLAENRKYGEAVVIAEQIPTKLIEDAVKNTNLKIMCRLTSEDERRYLGETMALNPREAGLAARLHIGQAIVYNDEYEKALEIRTRWTVKDAAPPLERGLGDPGFSICAPCPAKCRHRGTGLALARVAGIRDGVLEKAGAVLAQRSDEAGRVAAWSDLHTSLDAALARFPALGAGGERAEAGLCALLHVLVSHGGAVHPNWASDYVRYVLDAEAAA